MYLYIKYRHIRHFKVLKQLLKVVITDNQHS